MADHLQPPADTGPCGDCPCGATPDTPAGWCGLMHHGLGCHATDTPLTHVPRRRGATATVAVCVRCAARARWWQTTPAHRPPTYEGGPLGRVLLMDDGTRNPIGRQPAT